VTARPRPLVIAALPARSLTASQEQIRVAAAAGADLAEVRFDRWPPSERSRAAELFPSPLPLIATLRSRAEGGDGPDAPGERRAWHDSVVPLPFGWIDLEVDRDLPMVRAGPAEGGEGPGTIYSSHLPAGTDPREVHWRLARPMPRAGIIKVILPASMDTALTGILPDLPPIGEAARIVHTTGASGPLLRAWAGRLGFFGVYGCLPRGGSATDPVEPTQIPVDRLQGFVKAYPAPPLFAVIGRPIGHSRSPDLHHHWMRAEGRHGLYVALEFAGDEELVRSVPALVDGGFRGLNVTHPFKEAALRLATRAGPGAAACGCANTLTFQDGEIEAENTDLLAVLRRLGELKAARRWDGRSLLVVGTGGAARAALEAGRTMGTDTQVLGRHAERTAELARAFGARGADRPPRSPAALIVHATTVGRTGSGTLEPALDPWIGPSTYLLDFVYRADDRSLERTVERQGGQYEDGSRLLGYAAAASYEIWWGTSLTSALIDGALEALG
jgi:shikimate dehydrogenase